ncbi:MAG: T9SS type A sorting domain-containing protein [Balneolaceae bacterium]|nr:T9SS type A sorting domain-containing protein [Balneolaceae bacterium]
MKKTPPTNPHLHSFKLLCTSLLVLLTGTPILGQIVGVNAEVQNPELVIFQHFDSTGSLNHSHDHSFIKCLTPLIISLNDQESEISPALKTAFNALDAPRSFSASEYISPGGKFRIHYETSGSHRVPSDDFNSNGIPDYVEEIAEAADSSYQHEIVTLGFTDPIGDGEVYDVFVQNLANIGAYGLTNNRTSGSFSCNSNSPGTCIYIENDFVGYPPNTDPEGDVIGAVKVTMAHEFKHAIQFAQNNWQGETDRWAEMDATLMEEVVYDDVNDYYNYITGFASDLFNFPATSLTAGSYEDITWALYFYERFGPFFWTEVWQVIEANTSITLLDAIRTVLVGQSDSYDAAVLESYMWHYASGSDFSGTDFGFEERLQYPNPRISATYTELQSQLTDTLFLSPFAARYYTLENEFNTISEGYVKFDFYVENPEVHLGLIAYMPDGSTRIQTAIGSRDRLSGSIETNWLYNEIDKIGLVVMNSSVDESNGYAFRFTDYFIAEEIQLAQNYPNPFYPRTKIRVTIPRTQNITLRVFDSIGREIQIVYSGTIEAGFHDILFDARALSSGIYFYQLISEDGIKTKAMTLIK